MSTERDKKEDKAMATPNKARRAHDVLDGLSAGRILSKENEQLLRSFLPEPPAQMTLEALRHDVHDVWAGVHGNEWPDDMYCDLETWLFELHIQMKGLRDTPATVPELPAGMRLAVHAVYGRVVVSPVVDDDGTCKIFHLSNHTRDGSDYCWAPIDSLTFIDYEPAKPDHPEFLETEADYRNAPFGTIVVCSNYYPWTKAGGNWLAYGAQSRNDFEMRAYRRYVLRWGDK